jgi:hypothetical protein
MVDLSYDDLRAWAGSVPAVQRSDRHEGTRDVAAAVLRLLDEHARIKQVYDLVCELQDADQCELHSTGDECPQGEIENKLFNLLSTVRGEDLDRTDAVERGEKKRKAAAPSKHAHVTNDFDDCVSWCPACRENTSRGLNPDGTRKVASNG